MKTHVYIAAVLSGVWLFFGSASSLPGADPLREQIEALEKMAAGGAENAPGEAAAAKSARVVSGSMSRDMQMIKNFTRQVDDQVQAEEYQNALRTVQQWRQQVSSPQIRKMLETLEKGLRRQCLAQEKIMIEQARKLLKKAGQVCEGAEKPADCDGILEEMNDFMVSCSNDYSNRRGRVRSQVEQTIQMVEMWQDALSAEKDGDMEQAMQTLRDLRNRGSSPRVISRAAIDRKRAVLRGPLAEKLEKEMKTQIGQLGEAANAKAAEKLLRQLDGLYEQTQHGDDYSSLLRERLDGARRTLRSWINVLAFEESGQPQQALQALRQLENNSLHSENVIAPKNIEQKRMALLKAMLEKKDSSRDMIHKEVDALLAGVGKPEDVPAAAARAQELRNYSNYSDMGFRSASLQELAEDMNHIAKLLEGAQYGSSPGRSLGGYELRPSHPWSARTREIRNMVVFWVLEQNPQVGRLGNIPAGEPPHQTLVRLTGDAVEKEDWVRALQLLEAIIQLTGRPACGDEGNHSCCQSSIAGIDSFLSGQNLEKAGSLPAAVRCYEAVLRQNGKFSPGKQASDRLTSLRKQHPEAFAANAGK
ncbi:MAG: hypothetical protein PHV34_05200 [Verrucomicrobiae bacterium]|nr:hypothetical protein [Verrucomicrobiae bacterium]